MLRVGLGMCLAFARAARGTASPPVPQSWVAYGRQVGHELQDRLGDDRDQVVARLHAFLDTTGLHSRPGPVEGLIVRIWITPEARVSRVMFRTLGSRQADADLRHILTARPLAAAPPADMRQPMVLRLRLEPAQPETPT